MELRGPRLIELLEHLVSLQGDRLEESTFVLDCSRRDLQRLRRNVRDEIERAQRRLTEGLRDLDSGYAMSSSVLHSSGVDVDRAVMELRGVEDRVSTVIYLLFRAEARLWLEYSAGQAVDSEAIGRQTERAIKEAAEAAEYKKNYTSRGTRRVRR